MIMNILGKPTQIKFDQYIFRKFDITKMCLILINVNISHAIWWYMN